MNDLDVLRELRASVPEPAPARLAAGRARLTTAIHAGKPRHLAAAVAATAIGAAVAAAVAAGALAIASSPAGSHHLGRPPGRMTTGKPTQAVLAARTLRLAAAVAARSHGAEPAAGQWFYSKTVDYQFGHKPKTTTDEQWDTFDGRYTAYRQGSQLVVHTNPGAVAGGGPAALDRFDFTATPRTAYRALASLPSNPAALLAVISAHVAKLRPGQVLSPIEQYAPTSASQVAFSYLVQLMWNAADGAPSAARASVYLAMAQMPGVSVQRGITDAAGRPAIGVSDNGGIDQLLLDPHNYAVIGIRELSTGTSPAHIASKVQMIERLLAGLKGRQLAAMKAELKEHATKMWQVVKAQDALPWPPRGTVLDSLAIAKLTPVNAPGRR